jgi:hypothetical protein
LAQRIHQLFAGVPQLGMRGEEVKTKELKLQ